MMRIGFNIHDKILGQQYSAAQKIYLTTLLQRLNPSAVLVMDNWEWALAYKQMLPKAIVVFRQYNQNEGHLWQIITPEKYYENTKGHHDPRIVLYIGNEPNSYILKDEMEKAVAWWFKVIALFHAANLPVCIVNWGVGHPDLSWFTDDSKWSIIRPLFDALKAHAGAYLGLHEYASYRGLEAGNGRVGRHMDMAKALKARGYSMPSILLSEIGVDQIDDNGKRGWKDSMSENQYAALLTDAQRSTWYVDYIIGGMIFSYGSSTNEWRSFDVSAALVLHSTLIASNAVTNTTPPPPPPETLPEPPKPPDPIPPVVEVPTPQERFKNDLEAVAMKRVQISILEREIDIILSQYLPAAAPAA